MPYSPTKLRIEKAIDRFEDAVRAKPQDDEYYHTLLREITTAVAEWLDQYEIRHAVVEHGVTEQWCEEME
jgi:hypothetical protein